jgi:hypothetical protein
MQSKANDVPSPIHNHIVDDGHDAVVRMVQIDHHEVVKNQKPVSWTISAAKCRMQARAATIRAGRLCLHVMNA